MRSVNSTGTSSPGSNINLSGMFHNCADRKAGFNYTLSAMSSCGQKVTLASGKWRLDAGDSRIWSISYQFPLDTCEGAWEATMEVSGRGNAGMMDSASTTVMITE